MPRKRIGDICESAEALRNLERQYHRKPQEIRIRAIRMLREDPGIRMKDVAIRLECSESSVHRWWDAYRRAGIEAVIGPRRGGHGRVRDVDGLEELRSQLRTGEFIDADHLGRIAVGARSMEHRVERGGEAILRFLRSLPTGGGTRQWLEMFREALRTLLQDVDRVTVSVNVECDVRYPESYAPELVVAQHVSDSHEPTSVITALANSGGSGIAGRFITEMRRSGLPVDRYHVPSDFVYYISGVAYIGTIILWRDAAKPAISGETLALMQELEPMIIVLLSDCIARHQRARPLDRAFHGALRRLIQEAGLTGQEARIALLQLLGRSYKEIADLLDISLDTVGKHINSIHRKTRTRGHTELLAKYFTRSLGGGALGTDLS